VKKQMVVVMTEYMERGKDEGFAYLGSINIRTFAWKNWAKRRKA
jgi:hypothetical protein